MLLVIILPLVVRISNYNLNRIHQDDLLTGYFSTHYDLVKDNFFAPVPKVRKDWVSQFPSLYFVLQKIFFLVFGESLLSVKLSVLPYVLVTSWMLYLIAKKVEGKRLGLISVLIYSFFAPALYLETLGLHFMASTAFFAAFFYFLIRSRNGGFIFSAVAGLVVGVCYLFYSSSYFALPFGLIVWLIWIMRDRNRKIFKKFILFLFSFTLVLGPFAVWAIRFDNYFVQRTKQVSLLDGEWSGVKDEIQSGKISQWQAAKRNLVLDIKSIYTSRIGGSGGYDFGHLALLDRISLLFLLLGLMRAVYLVVIWRKYHWIGIFLVILVSFGAMAFSMPPPGFHRFSLAFPFLVLVMAGGVSWLLGQRNRWRKIAGTVLILLFTMSGQKYFWKMTEGEKRFKELDLIEYLKNYYGDREIKVAAYPSNGFEKVYYFAGSRNQKIKTDYHGVFLNKFNSNEKYIYLILFPQDFNREFAERDKNGSIIRFPGQNYDIFAN